MEFDIVDRLRGFIRCADEPVARFFQIPQTSCEIRDCNKGDALCRAAGNLANSLGEMHGPVFGNNDGGNPGGICRAQASTQVVRILNAIEHKNQRSTACCCQYLRQIGFVARRRAFREIGMPVLACSAIAIAPPAPITATRWSGRRIRG